MSKGSLVQTLNYIKALVITLRPQQWTKNALLFPALIFSEKLFIHTESVKVLYGFIIFCFLSSSIYILNDLLDLENDKAHPVKCQRPLPAGTLPVSLAILIFIILSSCCLFGAWILSKPFAVIAVVYFILQVLYSTYLKHLVILDVFCVAAGFVLRAIAGGEILAVKISPWLLICTMLLSLFLALGKRRHELLLLESGATAHRKILGEYSSELLDQMISIVTASTVVSYALYTISSETATKFPNLKFTIPLVLYGIFRYLYLIHQKNQGGSPEKALLNDSFSLINIILYVIASSYIIYIR